MKAGSLALLLVLGGVGLSCGGRSVTEPEQTTTYSVITTDPNGACQRLELASLNGARLAFEWVDGSVFISTLPIIEVLDAATCVLRFATDGSPCFGYIELAKGTTEKEGDHWMFVRSGETQVERLSEELTFTLEPGEYCLAAAWHRSMSGERLDYDGTRYGAWTIDEVSVLTSD